ncbi:hypothetical protein LTR56_022650 [Elasticomyces elasticus]|nr:hypothetical protein LTR56_022650 [Elasticomyces elasticus]KAK3624246.1 hypothetical protein LTR22_024040 [Elasticomyces elasticus]KAK4921895.1 hypothetical protein LTR49_010668 [Elasticomyces elasticus]KAK5758107.1 hypothetical protein LTS12_011723 [Elasticomyces elasticus]
MEGITDLSGANKTRRGGHERGKEKKVRKRREGDDVTQAIEIKDEADTSLSAKEDYNKLELAFNDMAGDFANARNNIAALNILVQQKDQQLLGLIYGTAIPELQHMNQQLQISVQQLQLDKDAQAKEAKAEAKAATDELEESKRRERALKQQYQQAEKLHSCFETRFKRMEDALGGEEKALSTVELLEKIKELNKKAGRDAYAMRKLKLENGQMKLELQLSEVKHSGEGGAG